jgi:Flp pilus assembly protein TadG
MQRLHRSRTERPYRQRRHQRSGQAQIELALFLPLLAMMLMMIFTVANAIITRMNVSVVARDQAWRQRYEGTRASRTDTRAANRSSASLTRSRFAAVAGGNASTSREGDTKPVTTTEFGQLKLAASAAIGRVLNRGYQSDFKDLVSGTAEQEARVFVRLVGLRDRIQIGHSVLRGSWDSKAITFQKQSAHKALIADLKFHRFDPAFKLDWLLELLSEASGAADSLNKLTGAIKERTRAIRQILDDIEKYSRKIQELKARIKLLEAKIRAASEDLDDFQIRRWKRLIKDGQGEIQYFQRAIEDLRNAKQRINELTKDF